MNFLAQYGFFLLKTFTLVVAFLLALGGILSLLSQSKKTKPKIEMQSLNKDYETLQNRLLCEVKNKKPEKKTRQMKKEEKKKPSLFVLDFHGDIKASQVEELRESITALLSIAEEKDEVVVCIESPGGAVNSYGLAASQLQRVRDKNLSLTICIDKIAASGGYLMASVGHRILAAPFAIIGSIGVVAQMPNFHRWLKKNNIDIELLTAGEYKRTLTMFAENTDKGRKKFQEDLEKIHTLFREYVALNRPILDIEQVATGEFWLAHDAVNLKLIDALETSDSYLCQKLADFNIFRVLVHSKRSFVEKLMKPALRLLHPWA